ncbi:MAG TPA: hypothetical protein VKZ53_26270 [Candidatus Angelobacter sp.]|nr:hypothetical protein [Candidatus Angelobacter sp.]
MTIDRRNFLAGTMLSALLPQTVSSSRQTGTKKGYVNILIHGLFFFEFIGGNLVLKSPKVEGHEIKAGRGCLIDLPVGTNLDLTQSDLEPGSQNAFPGSMLVIQRSVVGELNENYSLRMQLPLPEEILTARHADRQPVFETCNGTTCSIFSTTSGKNFGLLTCLRYRNKIPSATTTFIFHAGHSGKPCLTHANRAYKDARSLFKNPKGFDIQFGKLGTAVGFDDLGPWGISKDDQKTLWERKQELPQGPEPINCMMFGING